MKRHAPLILVFVILSTLFCIAQPSAKGEIKGPFAWKSSIYPGTERNYWIYVPRQYDSTKPACTMIVQDGLSRANGWKLPAVLDSLIALKRIPVILGVFVDPGVVTSTGTDNYPRYNRSLEYDGMGDTYSRFLLEELLPEISRTYNLSKDPNDRSIAGASSGAICAFNAAWERPDQFRRVLSTIGTYVGLRGADEFVTLVRKTEARPLRVFLQDGTKDLNIYAGDWWMANQGMLSALTYAGYEVNHAWGEGGGHDSKHSITIMAEALEWLWKDYPQPVQSHKGIPARINVLADGEDWKEMPLNNIKPNKLAVNGKGELFVVDKQSVVKIAGSPEPALLIKLKGEAGGIAFGVNDKLYVANLTQQSILGVDEKGTTQALITKVSADFITTTTKGIYFSDSKNDRIGFYSLSKKDVRYFSIPFHPTGLAVSAEQTFLSIGVSNGVFGYSYKINDDGSLAFGQPYIHYHIPYGQSASGSGGMTVDSENLLYTATPMGVQISDQLGRVNLVLSKRGSTVEDVKLGGAELKTLFMICEGKLYSRKVNSKGIFSWQGAQKPPKPGL